MTMTAAVVLLLLSLTAAACAKTAAAAGAAGAAGGERRRRRPPRRRRRRASTEALPVPPRAAGIAEDAISDRSLDDLNRDSPFKPVFFPLDSADSTTPGARS